MSEKTGHEVIDVLKIISDLHKCRKNGVKPPVLDKVTRRIVVNQLLLEGLQKIEIVALLNVSRDTVWRDMKRMETITNSLAVHESIAQSASRVNERCDFLWAKAARDGDWRLCKDIEKMRHEQLQSIGIIEKAPDKVEIDDGPRRNKEEIVQAILSRIGTVPDGTGTGGTPEGPTALPS